MAKVVTRTCDICGKETDRIVGKLHYIPVIEGVSKAVHSNYTHHADIGACCQKRLLKGFNFRKRMSVEEYRSRGQGAVNAA